MKSLCFVSDLLFRDSYWSARYFIWIWYYWYILILYFEYVLGRDRDLFIQYCNASWSGCWILLYLHFRITITLKACHDELKIRIDKVFTTKILYHEKLQWNYLLCRSHVFTKTTDTTDLITYWIWLSAKNSIKPWSSFWKKYYSIEKKILIKTYLFRKPRSDERHPEGVAIRVQNVEWVGTDCTDHRVYSACESIAYWNKKVNLRLDKNSKKWRIWPIVHFIVKH